MSNRKVIELLLQLKNAKAHGKNYIKVKAHLVRHLLRNSPLKVYAVVLRNVPKHDLKWPIQENSSFEEKQVCNINRTKIRGKGKRFSSFVKQKILILLNIL